MELDDLKSAWAMLERSVAINERLLRETMLRKVRFWQVPYVLVRAFEVLVFGAMLVATVTVLVRHPGEARYVVIASGLAGFFAGLTVMSAHQLVTMTRLDYGGAVTALQRDVARLKRSEVRAFIWALLGGVVFWLPGLLIAVEAVSGVEALARVDLAYLLANIAFGIAVLAIGLALATRYANHSRVVDALSGRGLRRMESHLAELAKFQREP